MENVGLLARASAIRERQEYAAKQNAKQEAKQNNFRKLSKLAIQIGVGLILLTKPYSIGTATPTPMDFSRLRQGAAVTAARDNAENIENIENTPRPVNRRLEEFKKYVANISEREKDALAKAVYFEMGQSRTDWAGTISVMTNRAYKRNRTYAADVMPYMNVLLSSGQFVGYGTKRSIPAADREEMKARVEFHLKDIAEGRFIPMETTRVEFFHANLIERNGKYVIDPSYSHNIYCEEYHPNAADKVKYYREISSAYQEDLDKRYREQKLLLTKEL
jgi:hypothetical protein